MKREEMREGSEYQANVGVNVRYYERRDTVQLPSRTKRLVSRAAFPLLARVSRETALKMRLVPLDDERVIEVLMRARGRLLDIGCGSNTLVRSYGNGVGVDVFPWEGCDVVIEDSALLPFGDGEFDTVSYVACLNHIHNRATSLKEARRVLKDDGQVLITMISPRVGSFVHWFRSRHDPDGLSRSVDHDHELPGMTDGQIEASLEAAGLRLEAKAGFVFGLNHIYTAVKA